MEHIFDLISESEYQKLLVFVHSKKQGEMIVRTLLDSGIQCAFYHADLDKKRKERIASRFRDDVSGLDVLVATSALGMGLNL